MAEPINYSFEQKIRQIQRVLSDITNDRQVFNPIQTEVTQVGGRQIIRLIILGSTVEITIVGQQLIGKIIGQDGPVFIPSITYTWLNLQSWAITLYDTIKAMNRG